MPLRVLLTLFVFGISRLSAQGAAPSRIFVTDSGSNAVSVIDPATNTVVQTIPVPGQANGIVVSQDGTLIFVTTLSSVSVVNVTTGALVASIPFANQPGQVAVTPDGKQLWVPSNAQIVTIIDLSTYMVIGTVPVGTRPLGIAFTPDGTRVFVANTSSNNVSVIDTASRTVVTTISTGMESSGVAVSPLGTVAYVTNLAAGTVSVIDVATNTVIATPSVGSSPWGVAFTPNGQYAYVANGSSDNVSVLSTVTHSAFATIPVSASGYNRQIAITADGTRAYVPNYAANNVSVIDVASNTSTITIPVGAGPFGIAASVGTGTISVTTNLSAATFTITGPATYSGSGTTFSQANAPLGGYTITYGAVAGYATPASQIQTLFSGGTITFSGTYQGIGTILVTTNLPAATFRITGPTTYTSSGTSFTQPNALPGTYTINYGSVGCYATPGPQTKTLAASGTINFAGMYVGLGTLSVNVGPADASGATFSISPPIPGFPTGGPYPVTRTGVPAGTYVVTFNSIHGFRVPSPQTVSVIPCGAASASGTYIEIVPVILIHGFCAGPSDTFGDMQQALLDDTGNPADSYDYSRLTESIFSLSGVEDIASGFGLYIKQYLLANKLKHVDVVAHSMGGLVARSWMAGLGGPAYGGEIRRLITLGSPHYGVSVSDLAKWIDGLQFNCSKK
ncbi:MAG TPA: beta-propeller fold lactonase family protein [Bryobacteraceae bacterium]|nr:beta-propeller fold lactonase family protein [Bryobacteraceae bacterium]